MSTEPARPDHVVTQNPRPKRAKVRAILSPVEEELRALVATESDLQRQWRERVGAVQAAQGPAQLAEALTAAVELFEPLDQYHPRKQPGKARPTICQRIDRLANSNYFNGISYEHGALIAAEMLLCAINGPGELVAYMTGQPEGVIRSAHAWMVVALAEFAAGVPIDLTTPPENTTADSLDRAYLHAELAPSHDNPPRDRSEDHSLLVDTTVGSAVEMAGEEALWVLHDGRLVVKHTTSEALSRWSFAELDARRKAERREALILRIEAMRTEGMSQAWIAHVLNIELSTVQQYLANTEPRHPEPFPGPESVAWEVTPSEAARWLFDHGFDDLSSDSPPAKGPPTKAHDNSTGPAMVVDQTEALGRAPQSAQPASPAPPSPPAPVVIEPGEMVGPLSSDAWATILPKCGSRASAIRQLGKIGGKKGDGGHLDGWYVPRSKLKKKQLRDARTAIKNAQNPRRKPSKKR